MDEDVGGGGNDEDNDDDDDNDDNDNNEGGLGEVSPVATSGAAPVVEGRE